MIDQVRFKKKQMRHIDHLYLLFSVLGAFLFAFALSANMRVPNGELNNIGVCSQICFNLFKSIKGQEGQATILFLGLIALQKKLGMDVFRSNGHLLFVFNIFIAVIWICAEGFRIDNTISVLTQTAGQRTKSFLYFLGCVYGINLFCTIFLQLTKNVPKSSETLRPKNAMGHITIRFAILLAVLWLPHVLASYPASSCYDAYDQLAQFYGLKEFTSHHPAVHSILMGTLIRIGSAVNGEFGLFLFVVFQLIVFSLVQGYMFQLMYDLHAPGYLIATTFIVCIFSPYYAGYIPILLKDNLYSYFYCLMIIELIYLMKIGPNFFSRARHISLYAVGTCGTWLFRNNGKYIIVLSSLFIALYLFRLLSKTNIKERHMIKCRSLLVLTIPIACSVLINHACVKHYNVVPGSIREALSLPFQQTARYVKYYEEEITDDERAAIDAVLDYAALPDKYNPRISDPVKFTCRTDVKTSDLIQYLKVWFVQFIKHPETYFGATLNQNYYLVYPFVSNNIIYTSLRTDAPMESDVLEYLNITLSAQREHRGEVLLNLYNLLYHFPLLCLLIHPAFHTVILLWLMLTSVREKKTAILIGALPNFVSITVVIFAPVIQGHPRYMFPVIFATPAMLAFYMYSMNKQDDMFNYHLINEAGDSNG